MILDSLVQRLEHVRAFDRYGRTLGNVFSRLVRPGPIKNVLSGTPIRHPAHPLLTDVTIGAWTGTVLLDIVGVPGGAEALAGIGALSAVPTALTGLNDLADITDARARSVAVLHAAGNVASLALFTASYFARHSGAHATGVALSGLGLGTLTAAGFLGGHLSYRLGVGVDQTVFEKPIADWTPVLDAEALGDTPTRVSVDGTNVMLYRDGGKIRALANRCTHRGGPLHKGKIADGCVTCPWHLSTFRMSDGEVMRGPATAPQPVFDARVHEGRIEVRSSS